MNWDEFNAAVEDASGTVRRGDQAVRKLANLCVGRLRSACIDDYVLVALKKELRDFNLHTLRWKEPK